MLENDILHSHVILLIKPFSIKYIFSRDIVLTWGEILGQIDTIDLFFAI